MTLPVATPSQTERIKLAVIYKATRFLVLAQAPLGTWGEANEFGTQAVVRPDYQIREMLYGLHKTVEVDESSLAELVTPDDVIRVGLQLDTATFPSTRLADVQAAIDSALDWVVTNLEQSWGVG